MITFTRRPRTTPIPTLSSLLTGTCFTFATDPDSLYQKVTVNGMYDCVNLKTGRGLGNYDRLSVSAQVTPWDIEVIW